MNASASKSLVQSHEIDFELAALEVIGRPVPRMAHVTSCILLVGLISTIIWLTSGKVDVRRGTQGSYDGEMNGFPLTPYRCSHPDIFGLAWAMTAPISYLTAL